MNPLPLLRSATVLGIGLLATAANTNAAPSARQAANVFRAYDKNRDSVVTVNEWLAMKRVSTADRARYNLESQRFREAEPSRDGRFTEKEFVQWYTVSRFQNTREGGALFGQNMRNELKRVAAQSRGQRVYVQAAANVSMVHLQAFIAECSRAGIRNLYLRR